MTTRITLYFFAGLLLFCSSAFGQERSISGKVIDAQTRQPLYSCSIYSLHTGNGTITEADGSYHLTISDKTDSLQVSIIGYATVIKEVTKNMNQVIDFELQPASASMSEVVVSVKSKISKAQRLVKKVIKNKDDNNVYENKNFQAEVYDKIEVDVKNIPEKIQHNRFMKPLNFILQNNMDTTADKQPYLPVYLSETTSDFYFKKNPEKERYDYNAIISSGIDNKSILTYIDGLYKRINIYDNNIKLVDVNFISPISVNALGFYDYTIQDTMLIDDQRCIQVHFSPIQYGTNGFTGYMWIADSSFAVKSVFMHMDKNANINWVNKFEISQTFQPNEKKKYMPVRNTLYVDVDVPALKHLGVIGKKTTVYKNILLNNNFIDSAFTKPPKDIASIKLDNTDTAWTNKRFEPLSKTERSVYTMMDTINKIPAVITYGKIISALSSGYYTAGKIDVGNLYATYTSDWVEGNRFNIGAKTNYLFNKNYQLKGYIGYSTRDQKFRYAASTLFVLNRKPWSTLRLRYSNDLTASYDHDDELDQNSIFSSVLRRVKSSRIRLVNNKEAAIDYANYFNNGFSLKLQVKTNSLTPFFNVYYTHDSLNSYLLGKTGEDYFKSNEASVTLGYVYREKFITENFRRGSLGSNYPYINLTYTKGIKINNGLFKSHFNYNKLELSIVQDFTDGRIGQLSYTLQGAITDGVLPILFLDVLKGNDTYYYNLYAFNNMNRYEFVTDKYVSLAVQQNFGSFPFYYFPLIKKLKWRSLATFRGVIGDMSEANKIANHYYDSTVDYHFTIPDKKPYMEVGVGIENILHLFRIDAIWRLNYLSNPNVPHLGIKGSVQFKF